MDHVKHDAKYDDSPPPTGTRIGLVAYGWWNSRP